MKLMRLSLWSAGVLSCFTSGNAAELDLATSPLFLGTSIDANVFFQLDDSGSMDWETTVGEFDYYTAYWENTNEPKIDSGVWRSFSSSGPKANARRDYVYLFNEADNLYTSFSYADAEQNSEALQRDWRARSSDFNLIYYNPASTYIPWPGFSDADFTAARGNPQPGTAGYGEIRDLTGFVYEVWIDDHGYGGSRPNGPDDATDGANEIVDLWDSRDTYTVSSAELEVDTYTIPSAADIASLNSDCDLNDALDSIPYEDCFGTEHSSSSYTAAQTNTWGRTLAQEKQNIANWYQYYRKRSFVAKAAISEVIDSSPDFRYGLNLINDDDDVFVEVPAAGVNDYSAHNAALLAELFDYRWRALGTPLRTGLERVGRYFDDELPGRADPVISECQQNFGILISDGYWSGSAPSASIGDADGDGYSRTVADVAKYYYDKDLSSLDDNVPTSLIDQNNQQHLVTFTVAFGVEGELVDTNADGYPDPELDEDDHWGNPFANEPAKIDDLWHAAFNSKGEYLSAQTPAALVSSLVTALAEISDRVGSSASVATNSGSLNSGSKLFQARFDSARWSGQLLAYTLNADGTINPNPAWDASESLDNQHYSLGRVIISYNPDIDAVPGGDPEGDGVPFRFPANYTSPSASTELGDGQIEHLLSYAPYPFSTTNAGEIATNQSFGEALVNYLRGDRSNEGTGHGLRRRDSVLGDLVDSDPQFVGIPRFRYSDDMEAAPYSAFRSAYADRDRIVYVGANDGMLHGFDDADGRERLAFIPSAVYENLPELAQTTYTHRYFVNEAPTVVDVFLSGKTDPNTGTTGSWSTVLVGSLGRGGQAVYALDVTDPDGFSEASAADIALWEFDDSDDADLGFTYSIPSVAKMKDGSWAAVFGNGYNNTAADGNASATGHAVLYIVDTETGELIRKIDTGVGSATTPNGLSSPALVDVDGDFEVDYIYAGDLYGNLWKFNVTAANPNQWDVAYSQGPNELPLFSTGTDHPITTRPQITAHPAGLDGYMVYFGTGKYLETDDDDATGAATQAFYGIWDKNESSLDAFDEDDLLQQAITDQYQHDTGDEILTLRDVTSHDIDFSTHMGWFIELIPENVGGSANSNNFGEKQVSNALVRDGRVIFTTLIPSQGLCDFGGSSFIMELDFRNGGQLDFPAFDLNGDGGFDSSDTLASGMMSDVGIVPTLTIFSGADSDLAFGSGSSGDVESVGLNIGGSYTGRQSWRQLR
ncbi:MAG: PilC/PilY family type IV pilus protein [Pseudohongiellaceae bacterium]